MKTNITFLFDNGRRTVLMDGADFGIIDYTGFESTDYEITTQNNINGYGAKITKKQMLPRPLSVEFESRDFANRAAIRQDLIGFFTPYGAGTLTVSHMGTVRKIDYEVQKLLFSSKNVNGYLSGLVELTCVDPAFLAEYTTSEQISTWIGGWQWKFSLPFSFRQKGEPRKPVENNGHIDIPVQIEFHGPATNPAVYNLDSGEFIRIMADLAKGEVLYINTAFGKKTVNIDRNGIIEDALHLIDLDSRFFWLAPGTNMLEYTTENEQDPQQVIINRRERYSGI